MNVSQNDRDVERLENAARSGVGAAQHRHAMIKCAGDLGGYPHGLNEYVCVEDAKAGYDLCHGFEYRYRPLKMNLVDHGYKAVANKGWRRVQGK